MGISGGIRLVLMLASFLWLGTLLGIWDRLFFESSLPVEADESLQSLVAAQLPIETFPAHLPVVLREPSCTHGGARSILILLKSAPANTLRRQAIRRSWAAQIPASLSVSLVFLLGILPRTAPLEPDLLVGNFSDSYSATTLKAVFGLAWAVSRCPTHQLVLLGDDDAFLNLSWLHRHFHSLPRLAQPSQLGLVLVLGARTLARPFRYRFCPHFLSVSRYPHQRFPPYPHGAAILLNQLAAAVVVAASAALPFLPYDDVYIGLVAARLHFPVIDHPAFHTDCYRPRLRALVPSATFAIHGYRRLPSLLQAQRRVARNAALDACPDYFTIC